MGKLFYEEESFAIRGVVFEVYKEMGCGYREPVYQECMERELTLCGIPFVPQKGLILLYKGVPLEHRHIPDLVCFDKIIVELKAVKELCPEHRAQVMSYLKATGLRLGLLADFGHYPEAEIERIVL
jgi:GxxExxY protein